MLPIFLNARDHLTSLRQMVYYLLRVPGVEPIILDNASTYPPLLDWYKICPVHVHRLKTNQCSRALWTSGIDLGQFEHYGLTDPDLDLSGIPIDWPDVLRAELADNPDVWKAGFSLEIEDLPRTPVATEARAREAGYWQRRRGAFWEADIDTTFALYRGAQPWFQYGPGLRADRPYTARHRPWYLRPGEATDEDRYYWSHAVPTYSYWGDRQAIAAGGSG